MNNNYENILNRKLERIYKFIKKNNEEEACIEYYNLVLEFEKLKFKDINKLYYECGILLFNNHYYEDSVILLSKAYSNQYMKKEIKKFIFENFIEPNREEFYESFKINNEKCKEKYFERFDIAYEELPLEFIPVSTDRYFIFDLKLDRFDEVIDFSEEALLNVDKYNYEDEFSDILFIDDFNIENAKKFIVGNNKKIYYYSLNIIKSLSFFKLPGILKYLERVRFFNSIKEIKNYFRNNLNTYIPHILLDSSDEKRKELQKTVNNILMQEHEFRLTKEGRCTNNILLSIGIPTWNRGNLALKNIKSLLRTPYDSEIEFVVSDNGSTQYTDEYLQIRNMNDSRVKYFRFDKNMGATINFANVMSIASGKYVLLLSDEDRVNLEVLGHYMNLLKNNENIALIRSSTDSMYINLSNQCFSAGYDALKNAFLTGNYISGIIYKKEIFNKYKLKDLYLKYKNNIAYKYYPHMFWDSVMALNGEFVTDSNTLIFHGKSVLQEQIAKGIAENDSEIKKNISVELDNMPLYVTYENRILQHYGFIELINNLNIDSIEMVILLYIKLCFKTNFLPSLVKDTYLNNGYDWNIIYNKILKCCIKGIEQLKVDLSVEQKELIKFYILKANNENR